MVNQKRICYEVFREIQRVPSNSTHGITVLCGAKIADTSLNDESDYIAQLEYGRQTDQSADRNFIL
ncbi:MAG: hypothetical protein ACYYK0_02735 [Candidatus Eutrophobiaceae bacterium]